MTACRSRGHPPADLNLPERDIVVRTPSRCGVLIASYLMFSASYVQAQDLSGVLRSEALRTPLAGVLVTVTRVDDGTILARVTTDARGRYRVRASTAPVLVRALRIGQQPVDLGRVTLRAGEQRTLDAALPDRPVQLAALNTRVDTRCRQVPVNGSRVAQLFAEARTALWQTRLRADAAPAQSVVQQVIQRYDTRERPTGAPLVLVDTMATLLPFRSAPVDTLLVRGFRELHADHGMTWSAPDAELLTSDAFLAAYCLQLADDDPDDLTVLGVRFEPARARRDAIQIRGTLWLDRRTLELRRITYGYRGVEPALARATPGGIIEYTSLPDGIRFISEWTIRMPIVGQVTRLVVNGPMLDYVTVSGVQLTRGHVVSLASAGAVRYIGGRDAVDVIRTDQSGTDAMGADSASRATVSTLLALRDSAACLHNGSDSLGAIGGTLRGPDGHPRAGVLIRAVWTSTLRTGDVTLKNTEYYDFEREEFTHTDRDGRFRFCALPRRVRLDLIAGPASAPLVSTTVRLRRGAPPLDVPLVIGPEAGPPH